MSSILQVQRKPMADISQFPAEMLVEIFNYFKKKSRSRLRSVCRYWNIVIGEAYRTRLEIHEYNWDSLIKSAAAKLDAVVYSLNYRFDALPTCSSFCLKLRKLELNGITLCTNLLLVLKNCESLEKLIIFKIKLQTQRIATRSSAITSVLDQLQHKPEEFEGCLPKLQMLEITMNRHSDENENNFGMLELLTIVAHNRGLKSFCLTTPTNIENCNFVPWFGKPAPSGFIYDHLVRDILTSNQATLSTIVVERERTYFPNRRGSYERRKSIGLWTYPRQSPNSIPYIRIIQGMDVFFRPDGNLRHPWNGVIKKSEYVQNLCLVFQDLAAQLPLIQTFISRFVHFLPRLQRVVLQTRVRNPPPGPIWNLAIFSNCTGLESLGLWHHKIRHSTNVYDSGSFHYISGIEKLPASLQRFRTSFTIHSSVSTYQEMKFENLKNLTELELIVAPWFILNGIPEKKLNTLHLDHFKQNLPKLKKIHLRMEMFAEAPLDIEQNVLWQFNVSKNLKRVLRTGVEKYFRRGGYSRTTLKMKKYIPG